MLEIDIKWVKFYYSLCMERRRETPLNPAEIQFIGIVREVQKMREHGLLGNAASSYEARSRARALAGQILMGSRESRQGLREWFGVIAGTDKPTAILVYGTLRDAHVLTAAELKQELGLPPKGRILRRG